MDLRIVFAGITFLSGAFACGIGICLQWRIEGNDLMLTCKVNNLKWEVKFFNPKKAMLGFCDIPAPLPNCHDRTNHIYQNITTNETFFYIDGIENKAVEGEWTCCHGTNWDQATVEVISPHFPKKDDSDIPCWIELTCFTAMGYLLACIISFGAIWLLSCNEGCRDCEKCGTEDRIADCITRKVFRGKSNGYQKFLFVFVLSLTVGIPCFVGIASTACGLSYEIVVFVLVGITFGVISSLLLVSIKGKKMETKSTDEDNPMKENVDTEDL